MTHGRFSNPFTRDFFLRLLGLNAVHPRRPVVPSITHRWSRVFIVSDRNLSAGVFRDAKRRYRLMAWRTYTDKFGREHATTAFSRTELARVGELLQQAAKRSRSPV